MFTPGRKQGPLLKKDITWAAQTQVAHWMDVIGGWKQMLGADWDKTYAASNTIYVARQNMSFSACSRSSSDRRLSTTG